MTRTPHHNALSPVFIVGGLLLVASSFALPHVLGGRSAWDEGMAAQLQAAATNYHDAIHAQVHRHHADKQAATSFEHARSEYERLDAQLVAAQSRGATLTRVLYWSGLALFATGCALYFWQQRQ